MAESFEYCIHCGAVQEAEASNCGACGKKLGDKHADLKAFLTEHAKEEALGKVTDTLYDAVKNYLLAHLYGFAVTVGLVAATAAGVVAIATADEVKVEEAVARPEAVAEVITVFMGGVGDGPTEDGEGITPEEQLLFQQNSTHEIDDSVAGNYAEKWKPAIVAADLTANPGETYGWIVVRNMTIQADELFRGYCELYVCPGVTVRITGTTKSVDGYSDFYVAEGGVLEFDNGIGGGANICNDGKVIIAGDYYIPEGLEAVCFNRGTIEVGFDYSGDIKFHSFAGATVVGEDKTAEGIHYHDFDGKDLYEGVAGSKGMYVALGSLMGLAYAKVGDAISFGSYEQDNNTANGKEAISWLVLAKEGGKALLISEKALDCQPYNTEFTEVTWETCTLRTWLNGVFLNNAFNTEERAKIISSTVPADKNPNYSTDPGNATTDKVFLLNISEAEKYFSDNGSRLVLPTAYAKANGVYLDEAYTLNNEPVCSWCLRTPGQSQRFVPGVCLDGSIDYGGWYVYNGDDGVRPAIWVAIE